jgi:hypothetical protein
MAARQPATTRNCNQATATAFLTFILTIQGVRRNILEPKRQYSTQHGQTLIQLQGKSKMALNSQQSPRMKDKIGIELHGIYRPTSCPWQPVS